MPYWMLKSEPDVFGIDHLKKQKVSLWDGVRNYQARNFLQAMQVGDLAFFYHSSTQPPGVVGLCRVLEANLVDPTQFDPKSAYFDPKATQEHPRWWTVKVGFVEKFKHGVNLETLRQHFSPEELWVVRKGNRLSVMPVEDRAALRMLELIKVP